MTLRELTPITGRIAEVFADDAALEAHEAELVECDYCWGNGQIEIYIGSPWNTVTRVCPACEGTKEITREQAAELEELR